MGKQEVEKQGNKRHVSTAEAVDEDTRRAACLTLWLSLSLSTRYVLWKSRNWHYYCIFFTVHQNSSHIYRLCSAAILYIFLKGYDLRVLKIKPRVGIKQKGTKSKKLHPAVWVRKLSIAWWYYYYIIFIRNSIPLK